MQEVQGFIVLLDISGYTRYVRAHNLSYVPILGKRFKQMGEEHAEAVVTDLLETLIESTQDFLRPEKLEGDAVLATAVVDDPEEFSRVLLPGLLRAFEAFHRRVHEIVFCRVCLCDCCRQMRELKLKVFVHHGRFLLKQVGPFREIAGQEVIRAHRLLKNSVDNDEYLMLTESVVRLADATEILEMKNHVETDEQLGDTSVWVHFPEDHSSDWVVPRDSFILRVRKMNAYFENPKDRDSLLVAAK